MVLWAQTVEKGPRMRATFQDGRNWLTFFQNLPLNPDYKEICFSDIK